MNSRCSRTATLLNPGLILKWTHVAEPWPDLEMNSRCWTLAWSWNELSSLFSETRRRRHWTDPLAKARPKMINAFTRERAKKRAFIFIHRPYLPIVWIGFIYLGNRLGHLCHHFFGSSGSLKGSLRTLTLLWNSSSSSLNCLLGPKMMNAFTRERAKKRAFIFIHRPYLRIVWICFIYYLGNRLGRPCHHFFGIFEFLNEERETP